MADLSALHQSLAQVDFVGRDLAEVLSEITDIARNALPATKATSVTLIRGEKAYTAAYSGQMALDADELQYERGYGPCMDAARAGQTLVVADMRAELRWPDYTKQAAAAGVRSSLSVPLPFQGSTIGALNNYSDEVDAFSDEDLELGEEVAAWVALAVANADGVSRTTEDLKNMRAAMITRAVIEQAKGILMERHRMTEDQAFTALARTSQNRNVKLREVARELVDTGLLPGSD